MLVVSILPLNLRFLDWIFNYSDNVILFVCNIFGLNKINFSTRVVIRSHKLIDRQDKGQRLTDKTMAKGKMTKGQTMINKTLHRTLKVKQHESH